MPPRQSGPELLARLCELEDFACSLPDPDCYSPLFGEGAMLMPFFLAVQPRYLLSLLPRSFLNFAPIGLSMSLDLS